MTHAACERCGGTMESKGIGRKEGLLLAGEVWETLPASKGVRP